MGIVLQEVTFDEKAPTAARIAEKVIEIIGLPLTVSESNAAIRGHLYELHACMAFTLFPKDEVIVMAYLAGGVKEHLRKCRMDGMPVADAVQGANEAPGTQTVYVEGYVGQEPTLFFAMTFALEALGGRLREPATEEQRREFYRQISTKELRRRRRKTFYRELLKLSAAFVLLPISIPLFLIGLYGI